MTFGASYDSHHSHQLQPQILHEHFSPNETFQSSQTLELSPPTPPPKRMRSLFLKEQPQLLVMDYSFWFGRRAVTGTRGWVSNSLLGFGGSSEMWFLKHKPDCGWKSKQLLQVVAHLTSSSQAPSRLHYAKEHDWEIWPKCGREKMSSTDVGKKTWPVDGGRCGWQHAPHFRKK